MRCALANIFWLGTKELRSFATTSCCSAWSSTRFSLRDLSPRRRAARRSCTTPRSPIVDEDHSPLSRRIAHAFLPP